MPLSWNEIKSRSISFSKEWECECSEDAEAKSFWDGFFNIFGISRKRIASFEEPVKKLGEKQGFIDLFWKGVLLVEHKSRGKSLDKAYTQALDYFPGILERDLPKYVLVSDFARFRLYDLEEKETNEFELKNLTDNIHLFGFIAGYTKKIFKEEDPVNVEAAELMGRLHDQLSENGYTGHKLEVFLVRILFCLFADDTGIFEKDVFKDYIKIKTGEDGSDTGMHLANLFQILDTKEDTRERNLDEMLVKFPYVNGNLFSEIIYIPSFNSKMRKTLLECCHFNWSLISPAVFGSLFQYVMDPEKRRGIGAHYTSEKNILKLINGLFLDELWKEFHSAKKNFNKLKEFHTKIANLKFLDPACGCGNFLIITYRELRKIEIEILKAMGRELAIDIRMLLKVRIDQMYGIEIEEFPVKVAETALWLMDHLMNKQFCEEFGLYFPSVPLNRSATIQHGNALRMDWEILLNPHRTIDIYAKEANIIKVEEPQQKYGKVNLFVNSFNVVDKAPQLPDLDIHFDYILGNPPFIGKSLRTDEQNKDMDFVFKNFENHGVLDYVTSWYLKAAEYMQKAPETKAAFVSTNSISQGEQVGLLWSALLNDYGININFAHRTFRWNNEAKNNANVFVVIIGFSRKQSSGKILFDYETPNSEPQSITAKNINPYLVDGRNTIILSRKQPLCKTSKMFKGSQPTDDGNFLLTEDEKNIIVEKEPQAEKYIKRFISAREYLNNVKRYCIWLTDFNPSELRKMPLIMERIEKIKVFRLKSKKSATVKWAEKPFAFTENRQPVSNYVLIPRHSSENRKYIPFGFYTKDEIVADSCSCIPNATLYEFGVLQSLFHMIWVSYVCGRIKGDYRYSNDIVYNNFPWPESPSDKQKQAIETAAQAVLDVRAQFPEASLADLYDPLTMPPVLLKAHQTLDKAVDTAYGRTNFKTEAERVAFLFELYQKYTSILPVEKPKKGKRL